jgi:nucleotide-binding universal stress UspA family protein
MGEMLQAAEAATRAAVEKVSMGHQAVVSVQAIVGSPAEQLLDAATGADMLVVGSRGRGGFARLLLGSVSSQVVHHAVCPTVVVPARRRTWRSMKAGALSRLGEMAKVRVIESAVEDHFAVK